MKRLFLLMSLLIMAAFVVGVMAGPTVKSVDQKAVYLLFKSAGYDKETAAELAALPRNDMGKVFDFLTKKIKKGSRLIIQDYDEDIVGVITFDGNYSYSQLIPKQKDGK